MAAMRSLDELINLVDPGWPIVQGWIREAKVPVEVLPPPEATERGQALVELQVTTRSPMGAIVYETGGILVDSSWLRLLGSGHPRMQRTLPGWNVGRSCAALDSPPPLLLVADDVLGGFFAINGDPANGPPGTMLYFAPDTLAWEGLGISYSQFVVWSFSGALDRFYEAQRWPGWQEEVRKLSGDEALSVQPFPWAAGPSIAERSRRAVPIAELWSLQQQFRSQLARPT